MCLILLLQPIRKKSKKLGINFSYICNMHVNGNTLGKNERLKSRKAIENLFLKGKSVRVPNFVLHYNLDQADTNSIQFTVSVSKRLFPKANDRNTIKRRIREAYRVQKKQLPGLQAVSGKTNLMLVFTGKKIPLSADVNTQLERLFNMFAKSII